jgi:ATP-dependent Clp protease ATP-binding subunit ClpC
VDFRNTIIIMTSNIGSRQLKDFGKGVGFETQSRAQSSNELAKSVIQKALKRSFAPEFLNRLDDVIIFNSLTKENIYEIIDIELQGLYERVHNLGYRIEISREAKDYICDKGYDDQFGARPLKRAIQKYVEDPMAETIIKHDIKEGDQLKVAYDKENEEINIDVKKTDKSELEQESEQSDEEEGDGNSDLSKKAKNNKN